jgi:hypothetical protein
MTRLPSFADPAADIRNYGDPNALFRLVADPARAGVPDPARAGVPDPARAGVPDPARAGVPDVDVERVKQKIMEQYGVEATDRYCRDLIAFVETLTNADA